ncbi:hypothetical protein [Brachybacterium sp. Marseille-Q7125]|uniref:hypothetical protein n=1 Tax=Brachybacterium sp. Marseille-Q7125 TaxID=2932815 RepID=UPI001FF2888F
MAARSARRGIITRRTFGGAAALGLAGALAACTDNGADGKGGKGGSSQATVEYVAEPPASALVPGDDPAAAAVALSGALVASARQVVIATPDTLEALLPVATSHRLPLLVGTDQKVREEIERLGAETLVIGAGTELGELAGDRETTELDLTAEDPAADLEDVAVDAPALAVTLLTDPDAEDSAAELATAVIESVGGTVTEVPGGQVRATGESVGAVKDAAGDDPSTGVLALGESFGPAEEWPQTVQSVVETAELPGGGQIAFPGRRMIAAYGSPGTPSLGILGEQGLDESIQRVKDLVGEYEGLADEPLIPAFEIITTVASAAAGGDGNYSTELDIETLRPWVDAAGEAGVYVVLDLQPGHTDFLTQAKLYEDLLLSPHVGLALDPEWRLKPGQKHMVQIGSVDAAEVNEVVTWLADLTRDNSLPQKLLILHQFNLSMIRDRQDVDTSRPELAITLHADGHGGRADKMGTWNALQQDLPEGIFMAWKNFYDEDSPMFTPEETYDVEPRPWFVSYQ